MLSITTLNVGHGDSIIIEYQEEERSYWGVIDSNTTSSGGRNILLETLKAKGVQELSFVGLTHPHADHYTGLYEVFQAYSVKKFYTFPINAFVSGKGHVKELCQKYNDIMKRCDVESIRSHSEEFIRILLHGKNVIGSKNWEEPSGLMNQVFPNGFSGSNIALHVLLPPTKVKGQYFDALKKGEAEFIETPKVNNLSLAFLITYKGKKIVLGGDGTLTSWRDHKRGLGSNKIDACAVKMPHHGSKEDSSAEVIDQLFGDMEGKVAVISANGRSHPATETLAALKQRNIAPYCTNLAYECGARLHELKNISEFEPALSRYISTRIESDGRAIQPCQGHITVTIDNAGVLSAHSEHNAFCAYRI